MFAFRCGAHTQLKAAPQCYFTIFIVGNRRDPKTRKGKARTSAAQLQRWAKWRTTRNPLKTNAPYPQTKRLP